MKPSFRRTENQIIVLERRQKVAELLAQRVRSREMARQLKEPLTSIRADIKHLRQTAKKQKPNIQSTTSKTSHLLVPVHAEEQAYKMDEVLELLKQGKSGYEITTITGIPRSEISRTKIYFEKYYGIKFLKSSKKPIFLQKHPGTTAFGKHSPVVFRRTQVLSLILKRKSNKEIVEQLKIPYKDLFNDLAFLEKKFPKIFK